MKIPTHVPRTQGITHTQDGGRRDTATQKKSTSVNWKDEHHQVDVKVTSTSNRQPLQIQLGLKESEVQVRTYIQVGTDVIGCVNWLPWCECLAQEELQLCDISIQINSQDEFSRIVV